MAPPERIAVIGGGSWGTALALQLAAAGGALSLWIHDPDLAAEVAATRENRRYLPGSPLPAAIAVTSSMEEAVAGRSLIVVAVPSQHLRSLLAAARPSIAPRAGVVLASKGIEVETLQRLSVAAGEALDDPGRRRIAVLSGPSFAREVAAGHPTAVVAAAADPDLALRVQRAISAGPFRAYTNDDVVGVELGGALKNVIAIGAGVVEGLGYGSNTMAAIVTRGLAEISRLAEALGGRRETLAGLAGLGDLVLTCHGQLSRNRSLGMALGRGESVASWQAGTPMVAEGVRTARAANRLAVAHGVEMPITREIDALLHEGKRPADAIRDLLSRQLTREGN